MKKLLILFIILFFCNATFAAPNYTSGKIKNITAVPEGLLIMMDRDLPDNCEGTPYGWMLIKKDYSTIVSVVLASWVAGKTSGTVYTSGRPNGSGYCVVTQFDPPN
ncbi:hypothetical protein CWB72_20360 [Pseudoalteromonas phenolica]|uniref:hypothetical protein n=1 Tax=Pseudoalteromonas phenolica TaxID=161398 RepID=UPI00110BD05C|nr:hypothetical protein [Pseudoalteromonas phenolica]TMN85275.1 hypothetical protein CWB72_20360 [Pseudoalteromonas phenolica]